MAQAQPVKNIGMDHIDIVEDEKRGTCRHVKNLEENLRRAFDSWALPGEIGIGL
jgi:hypothetical protein